MSDRSGYGMICAVYIALVAMAIVCCWYIQRVPVCDRVVEEGR